MDKKQDWRILAGSLVAGFIVAIVSLVAVVLYLFSTRPLHGAGPFPIHIYDLPPILGIWSAALFAIRSRSRVRSGPSPTIGEKPRIGNHLIVLLAITASVFIYWL